MERFKQRRGVVSFTMFFIFYYEACSTVLNATKAYGQRKQAGQKGENCSSRYVTE